MNRAMISGASPVISIVVAAKNAASTLQRCIDSVEKQTYPCKELIIIDAASNDGTRELLEMNSKIISYWESKPDRGIPHAWNRALKHLKGDWVLFLGADDELADRSVLERAARWLNQASRLGRRIAYGRIILAYKDGSRMDVIGEPWEAVKRTFFYEKDVIPHPACFHHVSIFDEYGPFDENFLIAMDYEFLIRVFLSEEPLFMEMAISKMAFGGLSHHPYTLLKMHNEADTALSKHGLKTRTLRFRINQIAYNILAVVISLAGEKAARWYLDILRILSGKPRTWTRNG